MPRGYNSSQHRLHIHGELCQQPIDKKYCSLNEFIREYGGDKTPLNLYKTKVQRLRQRWDGNQKKPHLKADKRDELIRQNWNIRIDAINQNEQ